MLGWAADGFPFDGTPRTCRALRILYDTLPFAGPFRRQCEAGPLRIYTSSASLLWVVFDHYSRAPNARSAAAGPYACTTGNAPPAYHLRQHYACSVPLHSSRPSLTLLRSVALNPATGGGRGVGGWRRGCACLWWITCPASPMRPRDLEHAP